MPKDVFNEIYNYQLCRTLIEARRLFAITYVLEILISAFRPHPWEIVKMSHNKIRIFDLSVSAFMKDIVYWGFLVQWPNYWSIFKLKSYLKNEGPRPPAAPGFLFSNDHMIRIKIFIPHLIIWWTLITVKLFGKCSTDISCSDWLTFHRLFNGRKHATF